MPVERHNSITQELAQEALGDEVKRGQNTLSDKELSC